VAEIEYPGVYVEEVPLGVAPIAGVETSTTGFIGTLTLATIVIGMGSVFGVASRKQTRDDPAVELAARRAN
jgi:phage tail sheath protein FI